VTNNLDTLATALHVTIDALLKESPELAPWRPQVGIARRLTDAELVTPAVMQALPGYTSRVPLAAPRPHAHDTSGLVPLIPWNRSV
jgi:hypothetical protein